MRRALLGRALVAALALGGALSIPLAPAAASTAPATCLSSGPCVAVELPGGGVDYLNSDDITNDAQAAINANAPNAVSNVQYQYNGDASQGGPYVMTGLSVNALLQDELSAQVVSTVTFAEVIVPGPIGSTSFLTAGSGTSNLSAPSNYGGPPTPGLLPVFWVNGTEIDYARPLLNDTDNAVVDDVQSAENAPLVLDVRTGPLLKVTGHASVSGSATAKIGQPITFTASSKGDDVKPTFTWTFDGTEVSRQQDFTHRFAASGVYQVQVTAAGPDDSAGAAVPFFVTVGTGHFKGSPKPGSSPTPSPTPTPTPTITPTPSPAPAGTASQSAPGATSTSPNGKAGAASPSAQPESFQRPDGVQSASGLPVVHGRLIGQSVALLTAPGSVLEQHPPGVAPAARLSADWRVTALTGSIAAIMLLFVAGAARELRWSRRPRSVVRPR